MPNSDLAADHARAATRYPVLSRALLAGASAQLRNKATTGGNLLQRTRCYLFLRHGRALQQARAGLGLRRASAASTASTPILGASEHCIATHPSDMAVAMRALDAVVVTLKPAATHAAHRHRRFYRLPGDTPEIETVLEPGELITHVELPPPPTGAAALSQGA